MIDSTKLKYKKFIDPRSKTVDGFTEGFSGELLLGTSPNGNRYIIKHTEVTDAGNEFVASFVARKMGIPVAKAHLLTPNKKFRCPYAVAIDYLDGLEFVKYSKELTDREKRDILAQFAFAIMLNNSDIVQLYKSIGRVVQVDFGDSFNMGGLFLEAALRSGEKEIAQDILDRCRSSFAMSVGCIDFEIPELSRPLGMEPDEARVIMIDAAKKILNITIEDMEYLVNELMNIYPKGVAMNYVSAIAMLQRKMETL